MSYTSKLLTQLQLFTRPTLKQLFSTKATSAALTQRQKIVLKDEDLIETFVKGSGPGGQCINKRSTCVDLRHIPTGIRVQCQQSRSLADNRGIARKLLREKLDELINGDMSKKAKKAAKIAKQKARRARRAKQKYSKTTEEEELLEESVTETKEAITNPPSGSPAV
ncbi:RF-1 domain-containing protein [Mycotypha africana]|uniref:RF-1 domain-containing protein n=1 Tax=Mycotypha africana TaxID=64632 RepID=UPI002300F254|nr:RF-1 domain-containing protein [Mycotypha africana]KAI8979276.1 RF-1 domain-containing protein [Mycotypha africana]